MLKGPSDVPGGKALHATQRMARTLQQLWVHLNRQQHFSRLLAAAEQLGLHRVQLPLRILQARFLVISFKCWLLHKQHTMVRIAYRDTLKEAAFAAASSLHAM